LVARLASWGGSALAAHLRDRAIPAEVIRFACRARTGASSEQALTWIWLARPPAGVSWLHAGDARGLASSIQRHPTSLIGWVGVVVLDMRDLEKAISAYLGLGNNSDLLVNGTPDLGAIIPWLIRKLREIESLTAPRLMPISNL
jgi:hypothetical protein